MNQSVKVSPNHFPLYFLLFLGLFLILISFHYFFVAEPFDYANKDFMSLWTGGKALLAGENPYDPQVWLDMRAEYGSNWFPDDRAPFPLWAFFFTAPFALLPIPLASALWMALTETVLVLAVFLVVMKVEKYRPAGYEMALLLVTTVFSIALLLVLVNGQMTAFLLLMLVGFLLLLKADRPVLAGVLLALLAVKPNPFIAFIPLVGVWLIARRQWRVIAGGVVGMAVLLAVSWLIQPGWIMDWLHVRGKTSVVTITPTIWGLAAEVAGDWWLPLGLLLTIIIVGGTAWFVLFRCQEMGNAAFVGLALAVSLLVTPYTWSYEHALLFLPWAWLFAVIPSRKTANLVWTTLAFLIPWLLFIISAGRVNESLAFVSPLLAIIAIVRVLTVKRFS